MQFNAEAKAKPIFKERLLWLLFLAPLFFLLYGSTNQIASFQEHVNSIYFAWELKIPFIPWMILFYMLLDILFGFSFLIPESRSKLQRHSMRIIFVICISILIFLLFPLQCNFQKPEVTGILAPIYSLLKNDLPYNQFPSLHVSLGLVIGYQYVTKLPAFARILFAGIFFLVIVSILFIYQHHLIDLPGGILVGLLAFYLFPEHGSTRLALNFISPKHLAMAIKYLLLSIIFTILAFNISMLWIPLAWIAASMTTISLCYVTGFNNISNKKHGQTNYLYRILFWPYFFGNYFTWLYWRKKLKPINKIDEHIYIGMSTDQDIHSTLKEHNIHTIIDLAPELNSYIPRNINYHSIPLLDLAIPDPEILIKITNLLDATHRQGKVLIICKLGVSRSVIAAAAWLVKKGLDMQQVWRLLNKAQPLCTNKSYMKISLQLYKQYSLRP